MKTSLLSTTSVVILALTTTLFSTCDLFNKADDVNFDATLEGNILLGVGTTGTDVNYAKIAVIDASSDPHISAYINKIKGFTVKSIRYQVVDYTGLNGLTFSGTLAFGQASGGTPTLAVTIDNLDFTTAVTSRQIFDLGYSQADIDQIQNFLKNEKAVQVLLDGTLTQTPMNGLVKVYMDVTVQAKAL